MNWLTEFLASPVLIAAILVGGALFMFRNSNGNRDAIHQVLRNRAFVALAIFIALALLLDLPLLAMIVALVLYAATAPKFTPNWFSFQRRPRP